MQKSKVFKILKNVLVYLFIAVLLVMCAFVLIAKANDKVVFVGGKTTIWVLTESMEPDIPADSYILIKKAKTDEIKVGDVITFRSEDPSIKGSLNTHEVISIVGDNEAFVTKGKNNVAEDKYNVPAENVVGVYVKNLPTLTKFGRFYMTPAGLASVLIVFALITAVMYIPDLLKKSKEKKAEKEAEKQAEIDRLIAEEVEKLKKENSGKDEKTE